MGAGQLKTVFSLIGLTMMKRKHLLSRGALGTGTALLALLVATPSLHAQDAAPQAAAAEAAPAGSTDAMVNLVRLLVAKKVISKAEGDALLGQAVSQAQQALAAQQKVQEQLAANAPPPDAEPGTMRIGHVPEVVRAQIRDELRSEVIAKAKEEGWISPDALPEWAGRVRLYGDFRFRTQFDFYSGDNATGFVDFERFNASGPTNAAANFLPIVNSRQDRLGRMRVRARLGLEAKITDEIKVNFRIASGDDNSPISTNTTLGGGLTKKNIWLDQAFIQIDPVKWASLKLGRMSSPFDVAEGKKPGDPIGFSAPEILFDDDLNFDGIAVTLSQKKLLDSPVNGSLVLGAFPLQFASNNYQTERFNLANPSGNTRDFNKWLFAAQARFGGRINDQAEWKFNVGYYSFSNVQGELSDPCQTYLGATECSTDASRATGVRKGNTLFFIRQITSPNGTDIPSNGVPQLAGLSFDYDVLAFSAQASYMFNDNLGVALEGHYLKNLSYDVADACRYKNVAPSPTSSGPGTPVTNASGGDFCRGVRGATFTSGDTAWLIKARIGYPKPSALGEWNVELGYRRVEPDAVLDSLSESDFRLGGTNAKGYTISGTLGLFNKVTLGGKWMSGSQIFGERFGIDVFQLDLKASF